MAQLLASWSGPAKLKAALMEAVRGAPRLADHINSRHLDKLADLASRDVRLAVLAVEYFGHLNWWVLVLGQLRWPAGARCCVCCCLLCCGHCWWHWL